MADLNSERELDTVLQSDTILTSSLKSAERKRTHRIRWMTIVVLICAVLVGVGILIGPNGIAAAPERLASEGWKLWNQGQMAAAEEKFAEAVKLDPKSVSACNGLGWSRLNQGKTEEALTAFKQCLELEPSLPAALNGAGQALLSMRKYNEAKSYLEKAAPQANAAWFGLARITLLQKEFTEAEKWCQKIVNLQPQNQVAKQMLGAAKKKELSNELQATIEPPDALQAKVAKAWQLLNQGQGTAAKEQFESILQSSPDHPAAMNGLGFYLLNSGKVSEAKPYFEKCIAADKNATGAMNGLARCLHAEGKTNDAIKLWQKLDELVEGVDAGTAGLASVYLEQGEYEKAKTYYERLVKVSPENTFFKQQLEAAKAGIKNKSE